MQKSKRKTTKHIGIVALALALILILWQVPAVSNFLERGAVFISGPFLHGGYYIADKFTEVKIFFESKKDLKEENEKLYSLFDTVRANMLLYEEIKKENEELKALLGRKENAEAVLGIVLSNPNQSPYDTLFIDVGEKQGVYSGMMVVSDSILLGVVDVAYQNISKVKLFSSPGAELRVLLGKEKIPTIAYGRGGGEFEARLPHDIKIKEGDAVLYSSLHNYLIGTVEYIESKPSSAIQEIFFRAPINIFTLRRVLVIPDSTFLIKDDISSALQ